MHLDGQRLGDPLTDNAHEPDEYRFHDVFHLAHAAVLGWSPVLRSLMRRKRKYDPKVDEVEDGARAIALEEGLTALVFRVAEGSQFFSGARHVDTWLLDAVRRIVSQLEVRVRTANEWEIAILTGYEVWRQVKENGGGLVRCDLDLGTVELVS